MQDFQAIIEAARQGVQPVVIGAETAGRTLLYLPNADGRDGELVSLERYMPAPDRKRGTITVFDAASFNMVLRDNADAGCCSIYVDRNPDAPAVEAVLNGPGKGKKGWCDYRARIEFRPTPQWAKWKAIDGKLLPQVTFAEFIEDNLLDIESPAGAVMLEVATELQGVRSLNFKRGVRLSDGNVQFEHVESTDAKVGAGRIAVPEMLTLRLAPLFGGPLYAVPARFRWRLKDGQLTMGVKLERIEDLMEKVLGDVVQKIEVGTDISLIEGRAPAPIAPL